MVFFDPLFTIDHTPVQHFFKGRFELQGRNSLLVLLLQGPVRLLATGAEG